MIPNGIELSASADPGGRNGNVVFIGRNEPRKGLPVLLGAWPQVHARTGAHLRLVGADPLSVRWLARRQGFSLDGIDLLGGLSEDELTAELTAASLLVAPSLGGESFGMVLTRAFACATPVVASNIEGYAQVADHDETGILVEPGDSDALAAAMVELLEDEERRRAFGAAARKAGRAVLLGADRRGAHLHLRAARGSGGGDQGGGMRRIRLPRNRAGRLLIVLVPLLALVALAAWRGPDPGPLERAFEAVEWEWVAAAVLINFFSVIMRAQAWNIVIRQAILPPWPASRTVFSAFCVGLLGNAALPGRVGELARVAVVTRHVRRRPGTWAIIVGTVFAHRLFDVVASVALVLLALYIAPIPEWASPVLAVVVGVGLGLLLAGFLVARRHHRPLSDELGAMRRVLHMARRGLTVLRRPGPAFEALFFQLVGWTAQLFAVYTALLAFGIDPSIEAAVLVLARHERRHDLPVLARERRPRPGSRRRRAPDVRGQLPAGRPLRDRPAGDRGIRGHRPRLRLPREGRASPSPC